MRCDGCRGSGACDACSGYGYFPDSHENDYSGTSCIVCDGSGNCTECDDTDEGEIDDTDNEFDSDNEATVLAALEMRQ